MRSYFRSETCLCLVLFLFLTSTSQAQFRSYSLPCLAPILQNIDASEPKSIQEAYLSGPKYFANQFSGIGAENIHFPISTQSPEAQLFFTQGLALLHLLSFREAEQAFRTVVHHDPDCPMGYWGLAQANELRPGRASLFAKIAFEKCDRNRPKIEQRWTELLSLYYSNDQDSQKRIRQLETLVMDFPENIEAKAFLIRRLTLNQYRVGIPVTSQLGVDALTANFSADARKHPSRHYRAFLWLTQRPRRILPDTLMATALSPQSSSVWRYAGEAHSKAGLSRDAALLNEMAIRADHRKLSSYFLMPASLENLEANYIAHIQTLANAGRIEESINWAKQLIALPKTNFDTDSPGEQLYTEALMKSGQWKKLLQALESDIYLTSSTSFQSRARRLSWIGLCYLALEQTAEVKKTAKQLTALQREALIAGSSNTAERSIASSRKSFDQVRELLNDETGQKSLSEIALPQLVKSAFYEQAGQKGKAYETIIDPVGWLATANFCRLAMDNGHLRDALYRFDRGFRMNASLADPTLPILSALPSLADKINLAQDDWKLASPGISISPLPDLEATGPRVWEPNRAPDFNLQDRFGIQHSLAQFEGKPLILNFFLGARCVFCLQQFEKFQPYLPAFEKAGITMAAISSDSVEMMQKVFGAESEMEQTLNLNFPFPVLADPKLEAFKKFRVFDQFENGPMHATILIDSRGRILWQNISHGTFQQPAELLREATRMLAIHKPEV